MKKEINMIRLSIIIPIYILDNKLKELTYQCLESVHKYTDDCEVIIIDNKPSKDTEEFRDLADIYIANEENIGNGAAWNQGAKLANGRYVCFMNNDVEVTKNWSKDLIKIF